MIDIELDGKKVSVAEGSVVMHAADAAGMRDDGTGAVGQGLRADRRGAAERAGHHHVGGPQAGVAAADGIHDHDAAVRPVHRDRVASTHSASPCRPRT